MRAYLDTSGAVKLLLNEPESTALESFAKQAGTQLVSTYLLETELRRITTRRGLAQADATLLLSNITLYSLSDADFAAAGLLPGETLRSLDALHVQGALALMADAVVTYDTRMADVCQQLGIPVLQPGLAGPAASTVPLGQSGS